MNGKTVLITGPDGTLGTEITLGLAKLGARIIMAVIDVDNANIFKGKVRTYFMSVESVSKAF
jgi:NAD(P)-dependent dehydrogenase (short-subunit alcohol dehydrogenase family)